jgi:quercetin dioxygenase-like cupin family protein
MATSRDLAGRIAAAEVVLPVGDLEAELAFLVEELGFRVESIAPADDPRVAVVSGHGVRLRLERGAASPPGHLRLRVTGPVEPTALTTPGGARIDLVAADPPLELPPLVPSLVVSRLADARWVTGRAGMRYRDLVPDRQGGRIIASHIQVPDGGPVPDYVHFHRVRFQMIFCARGRVRVVYEDQGEPFWLEEGDGVVQPPGIRHRVLECSPGLEVIELSSPAVHETRADHDLSLPTAALAPERDFDGQRFAQFGAVGSWQPWRWPGLEARDLGVAAATAGLAGARVVRAAGSSHGGATDGSTAAGPASSGGGATDGSTAAGPVFSGGGATDGPTAAVAGFSHRGELLFGFVLAGRVALACEGRPEQPLAAGDAFVVPAGLVHRLAAWSADLRLLEVALPGAPDSIDTGASPATMS